MENSNYKLIATLALLRTLYNNDKKNVYHVIAEMARSVLAQKSIRQTTVTELSGLLKKEFGVSIINPVLSHAIKKLVGVKMDHNMGLTITSEFPSNIDVNVENTAIDSRHSTDLMLEELCSFIEKKIGENLDQKERGRVKSDMCYYVSHDFSVDSPYKGYFGAFLLEKNVDSRAKEIIDTIYEGKILYDGLSGTADIEGIEVFDRPLSVYLETEILFHAAGLNGALYKHLFMQFYEQVESINRCAIKKTKKKVISLRYFSETENEITYYFNQAEQILEKNLSPSQPGNAMDIIVSSCRTPADVKIKEHLFWKTMATLGIQADRTKFDMVKNGSYSLVSMEEAEHARFNHPGSRSYLDDQRAYDALQMLSKVNFNRRNSDARSYKTAESIIVTGRVMTHDLSQKLTPKGDVPFAVSLSYLTNRFWFSFHKGLFDSQHTITSDQLLSFSQIAISQQINDVLREEYNSLSSDVQSGTMTKEDAIERIAALRKEVFVSPDEVQEMVDSESCYDFFDRSSIARIIEEKELLNQQREAQLERTQEDLVAQKRISGTLLSMQNDRERQIYKEKVEDYNKQMEGYVRNAEKKQSRKSWLVTIEFTLLFVGSVVVSVFPVFEKRAIPCIISVFVLVVPVVERYIFKLVDFRGVLESLKYAIGYGDIKPRFRKKVQNEFRDKNPEPVLVLSKEEDYLFM